MRFTDAHAQASVCTPTRYSLMTGQYAWRHPAGAAILSGMAPLIRSEELTLQEVLGNQVLTARASSASGTSAWAHPPPITTDPLHLGREVGFDYSLIIPATGDRVPCVYVEDGRVVGYDHGIHSGRLRKPIGGKPTGADHPELLKSNRASRSRQYDHLQLAA